MVECVALAAELGLGLEMMAFAMPDVLDGDWKALVEEYRPLLRQVPGMLAMHGPFMDMAPGSPDKRINQVTLERYQQAVVIASSMGIGRVIFHANFIGAIHTFEYHMTWHRRNLQFWGTMAEYARQHGVTLVIENMWEYTPDILGDLIKDVAHPNLRACLDVGHAHLYGEVPFSDWLTALGPILLHTHINNNDGKIDIHMGLNHGVLNYVVLLDQIRALPNPPSFTLEMDAVDFMRSSLPYLHLPGPRPDLRVNHSLPQLSDNR
jgi:sugar phosphate isomerase/epimerase